MVAEETVKLIGNRGSVVIVTESFEATKSPNAESQVRGFKSGQTKVSGVQLREVREVKRPMAEDAQNWPKGYASRFVNMGSGAEALVLFVNIPQTLSQEDIAALKASKSKLVFVSPTSSAIKPLLQEGVIHLAILNRFPPKPAPAGKESAREWFERTYLIAKPGSLAELQ